MTDLGPKPEPQIEPGEPNPGGVDAVDGGDGDFQPAVPDLAPEENPGIEDKVPDEIKHEENDDDVTSDGASDPEDEPPA